MFRNVGTKIKAWAQVGCWISIVAFIILGLILVDDRNEFGFVVMIVGGLGSWVSSWITYGFGELVDNSSKIVEYLHDWKMNRDKSDVLVQDDETVMGKIKLFNQWKNEGLITEEQYKEMEADLLKNKKL